MAENVIKDIRKRDFVRSLPVELTKSYFRQLFAIIEEDIQADINRSAKEKIETIKRNKFPALTR